MPTYEEIVAKVVLLDYPDVVTKIIDAINTAPEANAKATFNNVTEKYSDHTRYNEIKTAYDARFNS